MTQPRIINATPFDELNQVLTHLVERAQIAVPDNFVGAYLRGSFAVGDFSAYSACDFTIVTQTDLCASELAALQSLHKDIQRLPSIAVAK